VVGVPTDEEFAGGLLSGECTFDGDQTVTR
jgi:hypothetical protein